RPLVSAVASLRLLDAVGRSLEVRRRHVVEEQVVLEIEEVAQALSQVLLQRLLQPEKLVHSAVEPHVVDKVGRDAEDVLERGFVVPGLGGVQLAGGFAHAGGREDSDHVAPRDALPALRQFLVEEPIELERLPERVNEPDVAESPRAFYADSPASDGDDRTGVVLRLLEQIELVRSRPEEMARQLRSALPLSRVEGAEVRDDLLTDLGSVPDGANKPPVRVLLAV